MGCRHTARQNPRSADQRQMSKAPRSPVPPCTALLFPAPLCTVPRSPVLPYMVLLFPAPLCTVPPSPVLPYMALLFPVPPCTVPPSPPVLLSIQSHPLQVLRSTSFHPNHPGKMLPLYRKNHLPSAPHKSPPAMFLPYHRIPRNRLPPLPPALHSVWPAPPRSSPRSDNRSYNLHNKH